MILVLALLMMPMIVYAQAGVGVGVKAGVNFANQDLTGISTDTITDFHVGGYVNLNFTDNVGITPEFLFSAKGSSVENVDINTDYIAIPIMFRVKPVPVLSLEAGPQFGFLTSADIAGEMDIKDYLKTADFGFAFGGAVQLPKGFQVGARYVLGTTNIAESGFEVAEVKNRTLQIYAGWTFLGAR